MKEKTTSAGEDGKLLKPAKEVERLVQKFNVINDGPGLMPRVDVQVLLPHINDSLDIVASQTVMVSQYRHIGHRNKWFTLFTYCELIVVSFIPFFVSI